MNTKISLAAVGHATSIFLATTFALCVTFDLMLPNHAMYETWQNLLPGFEWISWKSFFIGLLEAYGYGWYFALIWVPLYNVFSNRFAKKGCCHGKGMAGHDNKHGGVS